MKWRLKIVPDAKPNADGEWIVVDGPDCILLTKWCAVEAGFAQSIPEGHHMVQYEKACPRKECIGRSGLCESCPER